MRIQRQHLLFIADMSCCMVDSAAGLGVSLLNTHQRDDVQAQEMILDFEQCDGITPVGFVVLRTKTPTSEKTKKFFA